MLTYSASLVAASVKVLEESATPDVQMLVRAGQLQGRPDRRARGEPGLTAGAWQMRPLSRGYVEAKSNRPGDAPAINPRYLSEESDRRAIIGGLRLVRRLFAAPALAALSSARKACPARRCRATTNCSTTRGATATPCYHASCTCMMGQHAMASSTSELRVHGLEGLRVIDASVMPAVTSTNTNAPTIMIAEKGAAMIKGAARQRLAA